MASKLTLNELLTGSQKEHGFLFPFRDRVPKIGKHIFTDLKQAKDPVDQVVIGKMLDTDYIGWTAKELLNIDLFPFQIAVLQTLWNTTFPMFVASRGGSKTFLLAIYAVLKALLDPGSKIVIVGAGLRQAKLVFGYIETIWSNSPVLRSIVGGGKHAGPRQNVDLCYFKVGHSIIYALPLGDGCLSPYTTIGYDDCFGTIADDQTQKQREKTIVNRYRKIWGDKQFRLSDESYCNGMAQTKKITTHHGFEIEGTHNHKLKIVRNQRNKWIRMDEMKIGDRILLDRSVRWHNGDSGIVIDEAYALGLLTGDGSLTQSICTKIWINRIGFATQDKELSDAMQILGEFRQLRTDPVHWNLYGKQKILDILSKFGISKDRLKTKDKQFPLTILKSSREVTSAFISGLFDSDGHLQVSTAKGGTGITIGFTNTSKELVRQLQYILLHYGIVAHVSSRKRDEKWERCYELFITGKDVLIFATEIGFRLKRKQEMLLEGIKKKKRWMDQEDDIPSVLEDIIDISENNRARHNTGNCVSVCAGRLKVRKSASRPLVENFLRVYDYVDDPRIDTIRRLADLDIYYDTIVSIEDSECVTFDVHIPDGHEYCANGFYSHNTKIRGFRATTVIADEFGCLDRDTLVETSNGLERISDISDPETNVINKYGDFEPIDSFIRTPKTDVYEVSTKYGYGFKCSNIHKVLTINGWKLGKDLTKDDFLIIKNKYTFPKRSVDDLLTEDMAWLMGLLISEGDVTNKHYISIRSTDEDLVERFTTKFAKLSPKVYTREAHIDKRGWKCKKSYEIKIHNTVFRKKLYSLGVNYVGVAKKIIPFTILKSPKNIVVSFLSGLFEGDGSGFLWEDRGTTRLGVAYYTVSDVLAQDLQTLLLKFDIIIARRTRVSKLSDKRQWILRCNGSHALKLAELLTIPKWNDILPKAYTHFRSDDYGTTFDKSRGKWKASVPYGGKTHYLGRYVDRNDALNKVKDFLETHDPCVRVQGVTKLSCQDNLYDLYIARTHSFYGNGFVQHNSIPQDVFDIVVRGFASTTKTPVEEAKSIAFNKRLIQMDIPSDVRQQIISEGKGRYSNQIIHCGTAYYAFNHFSKLHDMWTSIIKSKGDRDKVAQIFGGENQVPNNFDYRDYAVIRIPYTHLPEGLLDQKQISHAKATLPRNIFLMEFGAIFVADSDGFYSRSLIEGCTVGPNKPIDTPDGPVTFTPRMKGVKGAKYVMGVDPAAERDNLAITMTEVWTNHYRVVYCWAVNKKEFIKRKKQGLITDDDYYAYCCSRIREIVRLFGPIRIEMDSQGGGYVIAEMLQNKKLLDMDNGDFPIYEVIDFSEPKPTDGETDGRHILHLVKQSNEFNQEANVALHKSFETRTLLFPAFDSVKMHSSLEAEKSMGVSYDTYEENVLNIEDLKNELCTIQMSETATGKERFDTPSVVQPGAVEGRSRKGRLKKDRYTALLLSHKYIYDTDITPNENIDYEDVAGNIHKRTKPGKNEVFYRGQGIGRMRNAKDAREGSIFKAIKRGKRV